MKIIQVCCQEDRRPSDDFIAKKIKHSLISQCKSAATHNTMATLALLVLVPCWQIAPIPKRGFTNGGTNFAEAVVVGLGTWWLVGRSLCWLTEAISRQWDVFFVLRVCLCCSTKLCVASDIGDGRSERWQLVSFFFSFCVTLRTLAIAVIRKWILLGKCVGFWADFAANVRFFFLGKFEIYHGSVCECVCVLKRGSRVR